VSAGRVSILERLRAVWLLGSALLRTLFRRALGKRYGYRTFLENYEADNLPPMTGHDRKVLPLMTGCIACGLCELSHGGNEQTSFGSPSALALAGARSVPDFAAASERLARLPEHVLAEREELCPTRVPLRLIAQYIQRDRSRLPPAGDG
jgi:hypothetical protein